MSTDNPVTVIENMFLAPPPEIQAAKYLKGIGVTEAIYVSEYRDKLEYSLGYVQAQRIQTHLHKAWEGKI